MDDMDGTSKIIPLKFPDCHFSYKCEGTRRKFVVYVEGTLHT
jgi:hypothetical protein